MKLVINYMHGEYLSIWCPNKSVLLEQLYESHLSLQQSKPHPNAAARTKTKRHVSKLWPLGSLLWGKPTTETVTIQYHTCTHRSSYS